MRDDYENVDETEEDLRNDDWFEKNYIDLMMEYPKEWIAVINCEVIATGTTQSELEENMERIAKDREYSIYFVPGTPF